MSIGSLIRAAADGELTSEQVAAFEKLCAERNCTQDRVRFEKTLKDCCGRVLTANQCCTEKLRAKICAMAEQSRHEGVPEGFSLGEAGAASRVEAMAPATRERSFWLKSPGLAAAAVVLLSVAGVLIYQSASLPTAVPAGWTVEQASYRDQVAGFVTGEHQRCSKSEEASEKKLVIHNVEQAREHFETAFGLDSVDLVSDLSTGQGGQLVFWGGGDCHIPGAAHSGHVRFDAVSPDGAALRLSLFLMPDSGRLPMDEGVTYRVGATACDKAGVRLYAWRSAGVLYLLVSEASGDFCSAVRRTLHAPEIVAAF